MAVLVYGVVPDPNFVSSFVFSDNVYFFFREMAVENINCGKVSSVCKCVRPGCIKCSLFISLLTNVWFTLHQVNWPFTKLWFVNLVLKIPDPRLVMSWKFDIGCT